MLRLVTQQVNEAERSWKDALEAPLNELIFMVADHAQVAVQPGIQSVLASDGPRLVSHSTQQRGNASVTTELHVVAAKMVEHDQRFADIKVKNSALINQMVFQMNHGISLHDYGILSRKTCAPRGKRERRHS